MFYLIVVMKNEKLLGEILSPPKSISSFSMVFSETYCISY